MSTPMLNLASPVARGISNAPAVKAALFSLLREQAGTVGPLAGVSVDYAYNGQAGAESIYGGGWRSQFSDDQIAEGPGLLLRETVALGLYIKVLARPRTSVEVTDARAREIGDTLAVVLFANPDLGAGFALAGFLAGQGDYGQTDDELWSIHAYQVSVDSLLRWV